MSKENSDDININPSLYNEGYETNVAMTEIKKDNENTQLIKELAEQPLEPKSAVDSISFWGMNIDQIENNIGSFGKLCGSDHSHELTKLGGCVPTKVLEEVQLDFVRDADQNNSDNPCSYNESYETK